MDEWKKQENLLLTEELNARRQTTTEEERSRIWSEARNKNDQLFQRKMQEYVVKYKVDTITLRDELLSRLPEKFRENIADIGY
jgi:hypothetical protein